VETAFNVVKGDQEKNLISLLYYDRFFDDLFPVLKRSAIVDLASGRTKDRHYDSSSNPPIIHRKELLLPADHPQFPIFQSLTRHLEAAGLCRDSQRIGLAREWQERFQSAGYEVQDHCLVSLNGTSNEDRALEDLARQKTALSRYALSTPMQALGRYGYLDGSRTVFDYGCGKGDNVRILKQNSIEAAGWDPHFLPDAPKTKADIVNLGFVLNVIEDPAERAQALRAAYALADRLLSVAVMLTGRAETNGEAFGDGVRTSRNTFQNFGQRVASIAI